LKFSSFQKIWLINYYTEGYGSGIGYKIAAALLQNIVQGMDTIIAAPSSSVEKAYLRFAHAETMIPFVSLLGLFSDATPITEDSTPDEIENRNFRTSIISPFAANVLFSLYQCAAGEFKVKLLHNEAEYVIPGCDSMYCSYTQFKSVFAEALAFNFTQTCAIPSTNNNVVTPTPTPPPKVNAAAPSITLPLLDNMITTILFLCTMLLVFV